MEFVIRTEEEPTYRQFFTQVAQVCDAPWRPDAVGADASYRIGASGRGGRECGAISVGSVLIAMGQPLVALSGSGSGVYWPLDRALSPPRATTARAVTRW